MQQCGDIENCWRIVVAALHSSLGLWANNCSIPIGEVSDTVSHCAEDDIVATNTEDMTQRFHRVMNEVQVAQRTTNPGEMQKVSQIGPGFVPSEFPNACHDLKCQPPKCTTRGAGRHKPKGWKQGDPGNKSCMFTPLDVAKHKNLSDTVPEFLSTFHATKSGMSMNKFLYKCLGNGFSMKFSEAMHDSIGRILSWAGISEDVETSLVNNHVVSHVQTPEDVWHHKLETQVKAAVTCLDAPPPLPSYA